MSGNRTPRQLPLVTATAARSTGTALDCPASFTKALFGADTPWGRP